MLHFGYFRRFLGVVAIIDMPSTFLRTSQSREVILCPSHLFSHCHNFFSVKIGANGIGCIQGVLSSSYHRMAFFLSRFFAPITLRKTFALHNSRPYRCRAPSKSLYVDNLTFAALRIPCRGGDDDDQTGPTRHAVRRSGR